MAADLRVPAHRRIFAIEPAWWGLLGGGFALAAYFVLEFWTGRPSRLMAGEAPVDVGCTGLLGDYRISVIGIVALFYVWTASRYLERWTRRNALEFSSVTGSPPLQSRGSDRAFAIAGLVGIAIVFVPAIDIAERPYEDASYWILPHAVNWTWCIVFGWSAGRFSLALGRNAVGMGRAASRIREPELFAMRSGRIFARAATQCSGLAVVFIGLLFINLVEAEAGAASFTVVVMLVALAVGLLVVPLIGYRRRIRALKETVLAQVRQRISKYDCRLEARAGAAEERAPLRDLVALEGRVVAAPELPLQRRGVFGLVGWVVLGVGSWLGGALVERGLDRWLG